MDNILDLFLTNSPTQIQDVTIIPGLSDHDAVMIRSKTKPPTPKQVQRRVPLYHRANWQAMIEDLQQLEDTIHNLLAEPNTNVDDLWENFRDSIQTSLLKHIPHKTTRKRCSVPRISVQLRRQINKRNKLYQQAKRLNSSALFS